MLHSQHPPPPCSFVFLWLLFCNFQTLGRPLQMLGDSILVRILWHFHFYRTHIIKYRGIWWRMAWWNYLVSECHPCLSTWNRLRVPGGLPAAAPICLFRGFSLKEAKCSSLIRVLARSLLQHFIFCIFFPRQAQCQVVKDTNKIQNKNDGKRRFGRSRFFKKEENPHNYVLIRNDNFSNCFN